MKLHHTTIEKLLRIIDLHSGRREPTKLVAALQELDLSVYTQESTKKSVLLLTEELERAKKEAALNARK